ncbi:hypothetical protein Dda_9167 [Drechslerella dactyloides]|uniref:NADH dehydrogenase [ubiquinone] 1 beta subcomplex subunit 4 n=1 Tax=Drechslerella dactyloides TaxID=74499 RepID=A0AAD6NFA2_DREDA|nr:hypothetical protein Dda_9167 [Drechslerella dactyloides]
MAGNGDHPAYDPALLKWDEMNRARPKYFRWTPHNAKFTFVMVVAIPAALVGLGYWSEGRYELRGKRRGDVIKEF